MHGCTSWHAGSILRKIFARGPRNDIDKYLRKMYGPVVCSALQFGGSPTFREYVYSMLTKSNRSM
jgi:hypothetical protein